MRTSVETLSDVELRIQAEIPAEDVDREFRTQLKRLRKQARIKGFRPGKAPADVVRRMYGEQLAADTAQSLIQNAAPEALESVSRSVVGEPSFEPQLAREGEPLHFGIRVEVKPEIQLHGWQGLEVEVPSGEPNQDEIDQEIARLQDEQKERVPVEDRGADTDDVLVVSTQGTVDGEADQRLDMDRLEVRIGSGEPVPGFDDQLQGARLGEQHRIEVAFPDDFGVEDLQGRGATFDVEVLEHYVEERPELDDDLAQDLGYDSLDAMHEGVAQQLRERAQSERDRELENRLVSVLLERHEFPVPSAMLDAHARQQAQQMAQFLAMQGMDEETIGNMLRNQGEYLRQESERAVKRYLALEALADQEELSVSDEDLDAEIERVREEQGDEAADRYRDDDQRQALRMQLRERAALDLLKRHATIRTSEEADASSPSPSEPSTPEGTPDEATSRSPSASGESSDDDSEATA